MDQISDGAYLHAILANAPGHPQLWNRFLAALIKQLACDSCALLINNLLRSSSSRFLYCANIPIEYREQYENQLNKLDHFNRLICRNPLRVFYNQTPAETYQESVNDPAFSCDGQNHRFGVAIPCNQNHALSLLLNYRSIAGHQQCQRIIATLKNTLPALEEAIHKDHRHKINSQLRHHLGTPFDSYVIVDQNLNILFSDPVYTAIISQFDCVNITENRFGLTSPIMDQRVRALMQNKQEAASIHNQCHSCRLALIPINRLKNLYQWECFQEGFIIAFTHDGEKDPALARLMDIYRLSRCEAICALHFMKTPAIADIAASTYRSQETVRNHLKHVMRKMHVHSQAELMKTLISLAIL